MIVTLKICHLLYETLMEIKGCCRRITQISPIMIVTLKICHLLYETLMEIKGCCRRITITKWKTPKKIPKKIPNPTKRMHLPEALRYGHRGYLWSKGRS